MATLFTRHAATNITLPSAQGLMVYARREGLISGLLSGLSHEDSGLQQAAVRTVLIAYLQHSGAKDLTGAASYVNELNPETLSTLTRNLVTLANRYNWE